MKEKVLKYDKLEALKNKCYPIKWRSFLALLIMIVLILLILIIFSPFLIILSSFFELVFIIFSLVGVPIIGLKIYYSKIKWFSIAFVLKEKKLYLVQLINYDFFQGRYSSENIIYPYETVRGDERFIEMLNEYINGNEILGKVIELKNFKILHKTNKNFTLLYNKNEKIVIPNAYIGIESIMEEIVNE